MMLAVQRHLRSLRNEERAVHSLRFFKTGPGQYGEGDRFLGLTVPEARRVARDFRDLPLGDLETLLASPWHEERLVALLILVEQYQRGDEAARNAIYRLYLRNTDRINNWDLVDSSAPHIAGAHLQSRNRKPLYRLAKSKSLWERRISIVATLWFIRQGDLDDALAISHALLGDRHDLIHKACGWMLREAGKKDETALRAFLDRNGPRMPRTMLRYAIERLAPPIRRAYLTDRISATSTVRARRAMR